MRPSREPPIKDPTPHLPISKILEISWFSPCFTRFAVCCHTSRHSRINHKRRTKPCGAVNSSFWSCCFPEHLFFFPRFFSPSFSPLSHPSLIMFDLTFGFLFLISLIWLLFLSSHPSASSSACPHLPCYNVPQGFDLSAKSYFISPLF